MDDVGIEASKLNKKLNRKEVSDSSGAEESSSLIKEESSKCLHNKELTKQEKAKKTVKI